MRNFSPSGTLKFGIKEGDLLAALSNGKGKSPAKAPYDEAELEAKVNDFVQRSNLVKSTFQHWHQLVLQKAAYYEACQQSEAYRQKIRGQRRSMGSYPDKKRRISTTSVAMLDSPQKKRARRRMSSDYHQPRTDEELARRFKEVHPRFFPPSIAL